MVAAPRNQWRVEFFSEGDEVPGQEVRIYLNEQLQLVQSVNTDGFAVGGINFEGAEMPVDVFNAFVDFLGQ